jgi:hypothetical protein
MPKAKTPTNTTTKISTKNLIENLPENLTEIPKTKIDYVILESSQGQLELHRGRGGYDWKGQKGKDLEWILPVKVQTNADEVLRDIYRLAEWNTIGKGKECSHDSKELRSSIWQKIFPLISVKHLRTVSEKASMTRKERMINTQNNKKYNDEKSNVYIESDECYTFYNDVETIVNHFGAEYWKNKVVYMNCDDAGQSAFWIYFYNNFEKLGLKQIISTHFDGSKLDFSGSLFGNKNDINDGFIVKYDGKKIFRIPSIGSPSNFHGSYKNKECINIAENEADVIITNPPFSDFQNYYDRMVKTGKDVICLGNGGAANYKWTEEFWKRKEIFILPFEFSWFLTPTFKKKRALAYVFTNIPQNHTTDKIKPLAEIPKQYFDDQDILVVDNFVPSDYYKPFAVSINPIKNGILNSGYKLLQCRYGPVLDNKSKFARTIIVKELNEKGKPNTEFDNMKFEEGRINKTKEVGLL